MRDSQMHSILQNLNKKSIKKQINEDVSATTITSVSFDNAVNEDTALVKNNQTTMRNFLDLINENLDDNTEKAEDIDDDVNLNEEDIDEEVTPNAVNNINELFNEEQELEESLIAEINKNLNQNTNNQ